MPEYLAPGVYVEEVSFRSKSIEGVSTTTTGFAGPTRYGPVAGVPEVITSVVEFERTYGDRNQLDFGGGPVPNYMWHAVRQFFENGGKRLYVSRLFDIGTAPAPADPNAPTFAEQMAAQGRAHATLGAGGGATTAVSQIHVAARHPGRAGRMRVRITLHVGPNVLVREGTRNLLRGASDHDTVVILPAPPANPGDPPDLHTARLSRATDANNLPSWTFNEPSPATPAFTALNDAHAEVRLVTATVTVFPNDPATPTLVYPELALDARHRRSGANDTLLAQFDPNPISSTIRNTVPVVITVDNANAGGAALLRFFDAQHGGLLRAVFADVAEERDRSIEFDLAASTAATDGVQPSDYTGDTERKTGLAAFEDLDEISIVATPGSSTLSEDQGLSVANELLSHATRMRYRIAIIDSRRNASIGETRAYRAKLDSTYGAYYYPWVRIFDPVTREELDVPPSGFVAGIYARNDINRGVYKAPANEVLEGAIGLERLLNKSQQDILNPLGINCFRYFEGRGFRLWGARTISSDPEWKYVNLRRYFAYLEHSIDKGTQWAVFEPNGELLWANIRRTISDFLLNEWQNGALLGDKPEKAYFVKCDRSTMSQNDLDNGRLVCLVGVAALRPAEFVIIRIGQWTADRKA